MSEVSQLHSTSAVDEEGGFLARLFNRNASKGNPMDDDNVDVQDRKQSRYKTSSFVQFRWLVWRNFVNVLKNPFEIRLRIILAIVSDLTRRTPQSHSLDVPLLVHGRASWSSVHPSQV